MTGVWCFSGGWSFGTAISAANNGHLGWFSFLLTLSLIQVILAIGSK